MTAETEPSATPDPEEPPRTSRIPRWVGAATALALTVGIIGVILFYGYRARPGWVGVADKKFWDYLELLIVPAALAIGVYLLNRAQSKRDREAEEAQQRRERKAEEDSREREREAQAAQRKRELEVESQRAQDAALQAYLDQMSQLLLDKVRPLRKSKEGDEVRTLARARILTVLTRLDGAHKRSILQFLYESHLISTRDHVVTFDGELVAQREVELRAPPISKDYVLALDGADLSEAELRSAELMKANLRGANLREANLRRANLRGANLRGANLHAANLSGADLREANLHTADLSSADLSSADLSSANLSSANLRGSNLDCSLLGGTILDFADLSEANLRMASLSGAYLSGANLRGATITQEQLDSAKSLRVAIMPNGQKYPDRSFTVSVHSREGKVGRNDPCPCGSGQKYKNCHLRPGAPPLKAQARYRNLKESRAEDEENSGPS